MPDRRLPTFPNVPTAPPGTRAGLSTPRNEPQPSSAEAPHADEAPEAMTLASGVEACPNCVNGTYTRRTGPLWWQVQQMRCAFCHGTGRLNPEGE